MAYWDVTLHDGPRAGERIPTVGHGPPPYGFLLEVDEDLPGGLFQSPRRVTHFYKVVDHKTALYKGTDRNPPHVKRKFP